MITTEQVLGALLVVEVADTSLLYDRTVKMEDYATAGVQEYWIVDLRRNVVIVSRKPVAGQYMDVHEHGAGESWRSAALGGAGSSRHAVAVRVAAMGLE